MKFKEKPKTIKDYINNVKFQLSNVEGYVSTNAIGSAIVKTDILIISCKELLTRLESIEQNENT